MGRQLSLMIPEIDRDETQANVEKAIAKYRYYALQTPVDMLPKVTANYSMVPPTNTNAFHSSTEDSAVRMADFEQERIKYLSLFSKAVNRLSVREREAFVMKYMGEEELYKPEMKQIPNRKQTVQKQKECQLFGFIPVKIVVSNNKKET